MMTRDQLEKAARYLCKIRGVHPDHVVLMNTFPSRDFGFTCSEWENVARDIEAWETIQEAVRFGSASE